MNERSVQFWCEHIAGSTSQKVHFVEAGRCDSSAITRAFAALGVMVFHVNGASVRTKDDLMDELSRAGRFPPYFGRNWDALAEVLRDLSWLPGSKGYAVIIESADGLLSMGEREFVTFVELLSFVIKDWRDERDEDGRPFDVVFCGSAAVRAELQGTLTETLCDHSVADRPSSPLL